VWTESFGHDKRDPPSAKDRTSRRGNRSHPFHCSRRFRRGRDGDLPGRHCVSDPWARATPKDAQSAAIYFSILNKGRTADALVSASSSATANAMVHRSVLTGNIVRMEMPGVVELAPGAHLTFAPVGYHVMLEALKQPLTEGSTISLTLNFAKAGKVTLAIPVLGVGAAGPKSSSK
jgi:copper(I)-binding protein